MADTAVHSTVVTANTTTADPTGTTIVAGNNHFFGYPGDPPSDPPRRTTHPDTPARVATVTAGDNPPADAAGQGTLTKSMAQNEVWWVGPLSSARFLQSDGTVIVTVAASFAGTIEAFRVPRNA